MVEKIRVECPCCHGQKWLYVFDETRPKDEPQRLMCCHCEGLGHVNAERID